MAERERGEFRLQHVIAPAAPEILEEGESHLTFHGRNTYCLAQTAQGWDLAVATGGDASEVLDLTEVVAWLRKKLR